MHNALPIANWFLASIDRDAGDSITHLKLQKLVYYAQAWALALLKRPLVDEECEAWAHGPVFPSVYHAFRDFSWEAIPEPTESPSVDPQAEELLGDVLEIYGDLSAKHLERLTHNEDPWRKAMCGLPAEARLNAVIQKGWMAEYYARLYRDADEQQA